MSLATFISRHYGSMVTAPGGLGGQCVDLANLWVVEELHAEPLRLNARDWATAIVPASVWTPNSATNFPAPGDIVVWRPYPPLDIGVFGHIAVCLLADALRLITIDQDWPIGAPVKLTVHSYQGVAGWHRRT